MTQQTSGTATTAGAREHARAQEGTVVANGPTVPAATWPSPPADVDPDRVVWAERIAGGGYGHRVLARGTTVRLTDLEGDACAHVLLYNADMPWERLNVADTVKVQWQVYSAGGQLLLSDQARVLASVTEAAAGHHDAIFGTSTQARNEERYGDGAPEGPSPAGRELFTLAASKHGLGRRDLPPSVSFFQGVRVDDTGRPHFEGSAGPGATVVLRTEMPVVLLVANSAHPLDPREAYTSTPLEVVAWRDAATTPADPLWSATPEGRRAFENTHDYLKGRGLA
ncbi:urea amidolyase associated protein UAAP1 [Nocardioides mangrovi]|uniref:Urea carboxylase-associated family protein n=1 Tax=Nocardioides mangrovi TaxID=2874580 RepID=A0ABS7UFB7_9ACTN|nr:urea amidolyase associated protein UAAP1 [Nocardioides mangrovi]MBZ5739347.1 urea carboxylase-associated family protein [Nocardioides mangrovi]